MANQDFFLNFGSNAGPFAGKLAADLQPATDSILELINALDDYEGTVAKARGQDTPLNNLFGRLDQAAAQFGELTGQLNRGFSEALNGVTALRDDLDSLMVVIKELPTATARGRRSVANATQVNDADVAAINNRQRKALQDVLEGNAIAARNALKRVADINNTVARAATGAADQLSLLGKAIRDLRGTAGSAARGGIGLGGGGQVIIVGGGENLAGAGNVNIQGLLAALSKQAGGRVAATDAEATAAAIKGKGIVALSAEQLQQPAQPGRYSVLGSPDTRPVGFDVRTDRPGRGPETFQEYFQRGDEVRKQIAQIRSTLPAPNPADLTDYNRFRQTGGRQADDVFQRIINAPPNTISTEQVRASFQGLQLGALTKGQIARLPEVLQRIAAVKQAQDIHAQTGVRGLLQKDPWASFQGGVLGAQNADVEIGDVIRRAVHEIDSQISAGQLDFGGAVPGQQFRQNAREIGASLQRIDYKNREGTRAPGEFSDATVTEQKLRAPDSVAGQLTRAQAIQERAKADYDKASTAHSRASEADKQAAEADMQAAAVTLTAANQGLVNAQQVARARTQDLRERARQRKQDVQAYDAGPKTAEQVRALAERSPEVAGITAQIKNLTDTVVGNVLGGTRETEAVEPGARQVDLAARREAAKAQLEAFQTDPESFMGLRSERLLSDAARLRDPGTGDWALSGEQQYVAGKIASEREAEAAQSPEQVRAGLQANLTEATNALRQSMVAPKAYTDEQRAEARSRLEAQRETLIQQGISKLTGAGALAPATPALQPREELTGVRIYRGEGPEAATASAAKKGNLQGRFFTEDLPTAQEYAGPGGRVVSTTISQEEFEAARARAVKANVLEGLVVPPGVATRATALEASTAARQQAALQAAPSAGRVAELQALKSDLQAQKSAVRAQIDEAGGFGAGKTLEGGAKAAFDQLVQQFNELRTQLSPVNKELNVLGNAAKEAAAAETKAAGGGGRGGRPPGKPPAASAGGGGDDEEPPGKKPSKGAAGAVGDYSALIAQLDQATQEALATARNLHGVTAETKTLSTQQRQALATAGQAFKNDPAYSQFPNPETRFKTFAEAVGLPAGSVGRKFSVATLKQGGLADQAASLGGDTAAASGTYTAAMDQVAGMTDRSAQATLRAAAAQMTLNRLRASGSATDEQLIRAEAALSAAQAGVVRAAAADANEQGGGSLGRRLFGQKGFIDSQLRHFGQAIENIAGYTLVFSGFEKLRQLVDDGIQADAAFVRLQSSLDATGRSVGNLRTQLQGVSSATAQNLPAVVEAASELTGVFQNNADLVQGTKIAAQLANISQGTLSAKEAAIGLRDVTDAYGLQGTAAIQGVGDEIARLSQITGVSVKDIVEGTTQLAQEAKSFGLGQRQAAVLSAFVTRSTGETGESAAEQVSRILSTLNAGRVQNLLTRTRIPGTDQFLATREQFQAGDIGGVLESLLKNFHDLTPSAQQAITALVGSGRQARAFAGLLRDSAAAAKEFNNTQGDVGALASQNQRFLNSLAGSLKQLGNDFRNLGATFQQLGLFDLMGLIAKSVDELIKLTNTLGGVLGGVINSSPVLHDFERLVVILGEAAVAFRVLRAVAGPGLARVGLSSLANASVSNIVGGGGRAFSLQSSGSRGLFFNRRVGRSVAAEAITAEEEGAALGSVGGLEAQTGIRKAAVSAEKELAAQMETSGVATTRFRDRLKGLSGGFLASTAALVAISYAFDKFSKSLAQAASISSAVDAAANDLSGETARQNAAKHIGQASDLTPLQKAAHDAITRAGSPLGDALDNVRNRLAGRDAGDVDPGTVNGVSSGFDPAFASLNRLVHDRLNKARGNLSALKKADDANQKDIQSYVAYIQSLGLNKNQEAVALNNLQTLQTSIGQSLDTLTQSASGITSGDQLDQQLVDNLIAAFNETASFTSETFRKFPALQKAVLDASGLPQGGSAFKELRKALSGQTDYVGRLQAEIAATNEAIKIENLKIASLPPGDPSADDAVKTRDAAIANLQNYRQQLRQARAQNPIGLAAIAEGQGKNTTAVTDLQQSNAALERTNRTLSHDNPEYVANLKAIQDNKIKIAQLEAQTGIDVIQIAQANAVSPLIKANLAVQLALAQQQAVAAEPGGGSLADRTSAAVAVAQAQLAKLQAVNDQANSLVEVQIAQLNARGGAGDAARATRLAVQELQTKIRQYLALGGQRGDTTYNQLQGQLISAQRQAFDTALQANLDTLDFNREIHRITATQEIEALQQILKSKQLTLQERRDIILKIKGFQDQLRQDLTGSGFNIPSEIKLPTANQVRRSLGGALGPGTTQVVQTNTTANVQVPITVIAGNGQSAVQIANAVASKIGTATQQAVRANSSTPRLVGFG